MARQSECEEEECSICMKLLGMKFYTTECGHQFHKQCIKRWFTQSKSCPLCRGGLTLNTQKCCFSKRSICARLGMIVCVVICLLIITSVAMLIKACIDEAQQTNLQSTLPSSAPPTIVPTTTFRTTFPTVVDGGNDDNSEFCADTYNTISLTKLCGFKQSPRLYIETTVGMYGTRYILDTYLECIILRTRLNLYSDGEINSLIAKHKTWTRTTGYRIENFCLAKCSVYVAKNYYSPSEYSLDKCKPNSTRMCTIDYPFD
jgi:Zinc finger, C3HC4 type (RING finger)